ncbi:hypothetical protein R3P38DRAFT_2874827 [Favolaschia claudopus]|uniref:Uncharacterized protein n=1 Tax=Favolaschia claudopus TaxID=2862362 RepID=A0AAW0D747_9AGAR
MSPDGAFLDPLATSEWHTIRPGKPPLSLSVREITSVSVTFILSSNFSDFGAEAEPFLASLGLPPDEDNDEDDGGDDTDDSEQKKPSVISEVLAKGLSVNVNSATWKGVYIRIDDKTDEAVIIIYGLMPGKKYDIDLALVQGGQIRRQVVTDDLEPNSTSVPEADSASFDTDSPPSTSPMPSTPPLAAPHPQLTLEDRLNQLQRTLSAITSERDSLTSSLKAARRDAQKADAALRSEIEILKRASEKHTVAEHRARQKVLALQEAAKRAQISTHEMEELVVEVEAELPSLRECRAEKEDAYGKVKAEADRARKEREREEEKERRKLDHMKGELTGLNNKMERLTGKREKLESSVIPDLEEQLREIELEIERVEADPLGYAYSEDTPETSDDFEQVDPPQWARPQQVPGILTRPSPIPIQRPGQTSLSASGAGFPQWTAPRHQPPPPTVPSQSQHQRSASSRAAQTSVPYTHALPQRHSSLKSTSTPSDSSSSSSPTPAPAVAAASAMTSTLSSRAAPFEPGRMRPSAAAYMNASTAGWPAPVPRTNGIHQKWG